ncbi:hypothetical protein FQA39_LY06045 [Lamprigera yunnana]|nr:hypothetical protein FQA39_LY06045 [Lamprigera yunnana]
MRVVFGKGRLMITSTKLLHVDRLQTTGPVCLLKVNTLEWVRLLTMRRSQDSQTNLQDQRWDITADVEASDNENYDDTLKIILQQITAEKRVLQNNPSHEQFFEADGKENIKTPIEPNVQDMHFNPHSNVASTSTSSVTVTPKRSFVTVFNDVIPSPHHTRTVGKRKKEYTPSVITSGRWVEYYELKEKEKKMKEDLKAKKKKKRELQKNNGKKPQVSKRKKKKAPLLSEDEDEEEWIESGDSLDDIVINEVTDQETDDIIFQVEDLKVGDYILALFVSTGKRAVVHYKYVAKILQVLKGVDFEVQRLKSLYETKTTFKFIENDQCVIAKKEILGRLPDTQLVQFERILKTVFPAEVEVYEKL